MLAPQIFRSAQDTLLDVFSSPSRASDGAGPSNAGPTTPCKSYQRKRGRSELDDDDELRDASERGQLAMAGLLEDADGDIGMSEEEDEDVEVFVGHGCGLFKHRRAIKPLRKSSPPMFIPPKTANATTEYANSNEMAAASTRNDDLKLTSPLLTSAESDITAHLRMCVDDSGSASVGYQTHAQAFVGRDCTLPLSPDMFNQPF